MPQYLRNPARQQSITIRFARMSTSSNKYGQTMKQTYEEIVRLLNSELGTCLGMQASTVKYTVQDDPGEPVPGYTTRGRWESIDIPDDYMSKTGTHDAEEFLNWLKKQ